MLRVGLTGGLGSGKSFVGRALAEMGCFLIQADELGHQVLRKGAEAYDGVVAQFGRGILGEDGEIDRRKLAAIVFEDAAKLEELTALVHPPVRERERRLADEYTREHPEGIVVVEAAILVETGGWKNYDRLIVAVCEPAQQLERAIGRDGITLEEAQARLRWQLPLSEKLKLADYVIDTSGAKEHTLEQTRSVYRELQSILL
ncbi:MAG: dephospho-CoA kinase [Bryobacteraceae bacterium]